MPPFLIIQGSADKTVPAEQSLAFQKQLASRGRDLRCHPDSRRVTHRIRGLEKFRRLTGNSKLVNWLNEKLVAK